MTVLVIRAHKRFAVCRTARVSCGGWTGEALVVELSLDGCRIGNLDVGSFAPDAKVSIAPDGAEPFAATVRWLGDRAVGLRLARPFHVAELERMVRACRGEFDLPATSRAFGT